MWCSPFRLPIPAGLLKNKNTLQVDVTNLSANRIRYMDSTKVEWKKYFFVDINYKDFNSSAWKPVTSGLLGPVELIAIKTGK